MQDATCSFMTGGDIAPVQSNGRGMLGELANLFARADFSFLNVEHPLSKKGEPVRGKKFLHRGSPDHIEGLIEAGIKAVNLANNHILDFGDQGLLSTSEQLLKRGIPCFGAGIDSNAASAPVVMERNGLKLGLLGYTSTLPTGFAATASMAGVNPLRVRTAYRAPHNLDELPGTAPVIETWPAADDLQHMVEQVDQLKQSVDVVLVYVHWGVSMIGQVHEHQRTIGQAAIDAGADGVFGGHQHVVSAIEFYRDKPIVHCTGDLMFDVVEPWFDETTERNILFGATVTRSGLKDCYVLGCTTGVGRTPILQPPDTIIGQKILNDLKLFSEPYGTAIEAAGEKILVRPGTAAPFAPRFRAALHTMGFPASILRESVPKIRETVRSSGEMFAETRREQPHGDN